MGRDGQPKHRQARDLARKRPQRVSHDRVLIVCEGSKTEPNYFREIIRAYRLHTASVTVLPCTRGTAPIAVVECARDLFDKGSCERGISPRAFERVYAVFDRDQHDSYREALDLAKSLDGRRRNDAKESVCFRAIASVPCFELWLLLHYEDVSTWQVDVETVMRCLGVRFPGYAKGSNDVFARTCDRLDTAKHHARILAEQSDAYGAPAPYTAVFELVELLCSLRT
ncbi:RloB family protein [Plasticicumulans acidivorans]|uniref:RloB-like protein n=1 Tax=Plasticicumulans acidivorans TaxID=886464 RepID=A0A317N0K7_9GAMM|nr:RloB family protein [Plasticicumulans acidivorans]PWV65680.1 RloB-like protein [Plasticicumulans acidivorans]